MHGEKIAFEVNSFTDVFLILIFHIVLCLTQAYVRLHVVTEGGNNHTYVTMYKHAHAHTHYLMFLFYSQVIKSEMVQIGNGYKGLKASISLQL